MSLVIAED
jgi:hypothetical protein